MTATRFVPASPPCKPAPIRWPRRNRKREHRSTCFTSAVNTCTQQITDETKVISQLGDADVTDASTQLSLAQYALNATLTAASQTLQLSLVNLLDK